MIVAAAFVAGVLFSAPMVIWGTLLQRRVPAHLLGRVASLDFFVSVSLMPVSMALAGPVSDAVGITTTFLVAGLVPVAAAVVAIGMRCPPTRSPTRCATVRWLGEGDELVGRRRARSAQD